MNVDRNIIQLWPTPVNELECAYEPEPVPPGAAILIASIDWLAEHWLGIAGGFILGMAVTVGLADLLEAVVL